MRTSPEPIGDPATPAAELESFRLRRRSIFYPKTDAPLPDALLRSLRESGPPVPPADVADLCRLLLGEGPASCRPLDQQGTFHALYRVALKRGGALIVRVNALGRLGRDFPLHLDRWAMGRLRSAGLPALRVLAVDTTRRLAPFDFEVMEEARGGSLRDFDHDESRIRPLLRELGRLVAQVHAIGAEGFGWIDVAPLVLDGPDAPAAGIFDAWRDYVRLNLDEHIGACVASGAISPDEARRVAGAFDAHDALLVGVEPALLHGDLGNHNVFTDGRSATALIDWEDCLAGDPAFDVAFWGTFHPDDRRDSFLEGYRSARALPDDFERRYWLYYLRIALSKTVHRHRFGYADRPGRPPASGRIKKALEALERA
jgi:aminoglycoside phosphotransferase (APT) family kinase protein